MAENHGGSAFPLMTGTRYHYGLTKREWFATFAPEPPGHDINHEMEMDRLRNPHNEPHKPPRRSQLEIVADLKYRYADAMVQAGGA